MKKYLFIAAAAVAMLASCSQSDDLSAPVTQQNTEDNAVQFGTYVGGSAGSRATVGKTGDINTTVLHTGTGATDGFGVFAYYTKSTDYTYNQTEFKPNFMYNQQVTTDGSTGWTYSPTKYWPNGLNDQDNGVGGDDETLTAGGKVSFFAYAPYVAAAGTPDTDDGIIGMSANNTQANPTITYQMPSTGIVDLLWGTANSSGNDLAGNTQAGTTLSDHTATNGAATPEHYKVNADLTKQQIDGKVNFKFIHALAKVGGSTNDGVAGGLQIMLDIDALSGGAAEDANTKVTVKEIKINTDYNHNGNLTDDDITMYKKGTLDLATGLWTLSNLAADKYGVNQTITTAGTAPASQLNPDIAEPATVTSWSSLNGINGVKIAPKNVYASGLENSPLLFIPGTTPKLQFTITYYVRTQDSKLDGEYSEVEQTVSKTVTFGAPVKINKKYNIIIHLGLTSVKFEATVDSWSADIDDDGDVDATDQTTVFLPLNVE